MRRAQTGGAMLSGGRCLRRPPNRRAGWAAKCVHHVERTMWWVAGAQLHTPEPAGGGLRRPASSRPRAQSRKWVYTVGRPPRGEPLNSKDMQVRCGWRLRPAPWPVALPMVPRDHVNASARSAAGGCPGTGGFRTREAPSGSAALAGPCGSRSASCSGSKSARCPWSWRQGPPFPPLLPPRLPLDLPLCSCGRRF